MSEIITNRFPRQHGAPWRDEEYHRLISGIEQGLTLAQLAERHQRTPGGIRSAARRLLPPALFQNNRSNSVNALARYLSETENVDRQSLINAICLPPATGEVLDQNHDVEIHTTLVGQGVSSSATVSSEIDYTQEEKQRKTLITNTEFLGYEASDADVIMLVSAAVASLSKERDRDALLMRLGVEEQPLTLAEIGAKWGVSHERVRQIQERAFRRLSAQARREGTPGAALKKLIESACSSSNEMAMWVLSIIHNDFVISPQLASKFILRTAGFPNDKVVEIVGFFSTIAQLQKARFRELDYSRAATERIESVISNWLKYADWPITLAPPTPVGQLSAQRVVNDSDIAGNFYSSKLDRTVQYESGLELDILTLLERSEQVSYYQEQPVLIPYIFKGRKLKYYPDLFVATLDGRGLLVEVKPTDNMALSINRAKASAGRAWAHAQGWGWLVVSDRHTFRQLEEHIISASKWELIENELKASGVLTWREMISLRTQYGLTRFDLTAYIIQSGAELDRAYRITAQNVHDF